ncbi:transglutaminase [Paenibacillus spiritus]|uniref:Transglutaminase n=1 Tax=Paenibacillus spiritus TaxID=2496557 RepID=A0A5J5G5D2_9BACL|nr:transglutaminase domain-containing protein [Paenibacillus spiritus]KAA9002093.1 transglutaminase [Paenibacillus spiritus]
MGKITKAVLLGMLVAAAVPPVVYWGRDEAYAASKDAALRNTAEMTARLAGAMTNRREGVSFAYAGSTSRLKAAIKTSIEQAMASDPYLYYIVDSYAYSYQGGSKSAQVSVKLKYRESLQETAYVDARVKAVLQKIVHPGMNPHEKVKAIHDWVVLNLRYDLSYTRYTAYEALHDGSAVCQGYSLLTYKLLKAAGIPVRIAEGTARQNGRSQSHAWNLVQLEGKWYHLDTTWDDPLPDRSGEASTNYYLLSDAQMRQDHSWTRDYPAAGTVYAGTLEKLAAAGGSEAAVYRALEKDLGYDILNEEQAVGSAAELSILALQKKAEGGTSVQFRYRGGESSLKSDLQQLYKLGFESLSYSAERLAGTNDLKVEVNWKS